MIAKRQSNETLHRDTEQRLQNEKALAFTVLIKLQDIVNNVVTMHRHVERSRRIVVANPDENIELWEVLQPLAGTTDEGQIRFTADELGVFANGDHNDLIMNLSLFARRNAAHMASLAEYNERKKAFNEIRPRPHVVDGRLVYVPLSAQQVAEMLPYTIPLRDLANSLSGYITSDIPLARLVCEQYSNAIRNKFPNAHMKQLQFPNEQEIEQIIQED